MELAVAHLYIWGHLKTPDITEFVDALAFHKCQISFNDVTRDDLLQHVAEKGAMASDPLSLGHVQAPDGRFPKVEEFCIKRKLSFLISIESEDKGGNRVVQFNAAKDKCEKEIYVDESGEFPVNRAELLKLLSRETRKNRVNSDSYYRLIAGIKRLTANPVIKTGIFTYGDSHNSRRRIHKKK